LRDIAGFCADDDNFGGCFRCTRSPMMGSARAYLKLSSLEIIFEVFQEGILRK